MILVLFGSFATFAIVAIFVLWYKLLLEYKIGNFPTPPRYFLIGHAPYLSSNDKVLSYVHRNLLENKGFSLIYIGLKALLCTSDVEFSKWILNSENITKTDEYQYLKPWLGQGLLLSTGQHWKLHRKILTPAFHYKMIKNHVKVLRKTTSILIEKLEKNIGNPGFDVYPLITSFALDAVCESTMATSVNAQENSNSKYMQSVQNILRISFERVFEIFKMYNFSFRFHKDYKVFHDAIKDIHTFNISVMEKRRNELKNQPEDLEENEEECGRKKRPFIDILLNATDENNQSLTDQDILEEVNTIIIAGYDTAASSISFALYNLAQHPDVQSRVIEEQRELFGSEKNPFVTYADLNNMKYLEMTIKESLRLFPPIPMIGRKMHEDCYFDGKLLPKGLSVMLSLYTLHRNPEVFPEPEKFDPSRFENEASMAYSWLPFSAGQRNCIGQKFAMNEMKQAISAILRNFELLPVPNHVLDVRAEASLKSSNGICIKIKKRE